MADSKKYDGSTWEHSLRKLVAGTEIITTFPTTIYADGSSATATLQGNMQQTGTPTPNSPIYPTECGDLETTGEHAGQYKIPISSGGTTTPVYLSEPLRKIGDTVDTLASSGTVTYNIYKWVFDGTENWILYGTGSNRYFALSAPYACVGQLRDYILTTHFEENRTVIFVTNGTILRVYDTSDWVDETAFKTWLSTQYAAGTPVTVYYVLATPTTETVTVPPIPTITGKDSFDVQTTLKPSEVSLAYTGWHDASAKEWDGSQWD